MKRLLIAACVVAAVIPASEGATAPGTPAWAQEFLATCVENRWDMKQIMSLAPKRGYRVLDEPRPAGFAWLGVFIKGSGNQLIALSVSRSQESTRDGLELMTNCRVEAMDPTGQGAKAIQDWVGLPWKTGEDGPSVFFTETDQRRIAVTDTSDAKRRYGAVYLLSIWPHNGHTDVALSKWQPAITVPVIAR